MQFTRLSDINLQNKKILVRVDINVPIKNGKVTDDTRIKAIIPTLNYLLDRNCKIILISHFGRPKGKKNSEMSLSQIVDNISKLISQKIYFHHDCIGNTTKEAINKINFGNVILLENLRFYAEEEKNDPKFSQQLAELADIYVNDAFSCSHRAHASIVGVAKFLPSIAGLQMQKELDNLNNLLANPKKPMIAIVGGAKISTKINLIKNLTKIADAIYIAGAMANTFFYAQGKEVGKSLFEKDYKDIALETFEIAKINNCQILLPQDVVVTKNLIENAEYKNISVNEVEQNDIIADIGEQSINEIEKLLTNYETVLWNGPLGAFEIKPFNIGSEKLAKIIANTTCNNGTISVAGGGDSVAAINAINLSDKFSYISTAGGAFLEWLEGLELPGIKALNKTKS